MRREIVELRILPPFAIGRLGSSDSPMDNYNLTTPDPIGPRQIVPAETLTVDVTTGAAHKVIPRVPLRFRDVNGRIRPVAPFLELWARFKGGLEFQQLTTSILKEFRFGSEAVCWRAHVANLKIFRRTGDPADRIDARTRWFSTHQVKELRGRCDNFLTNKTIPLGSVQYIAPSGDLPEIRLRFTPAGGRIYGPPPADGTTDLNIADAVYNDLKGSWKGYSEPDDRSKAPNSGRLLTRPSQIFAGESKDEDTNGKLVSFGYLDDECDGIVEAKLETCSGTLTAFARIAAGPPSFAPDSMPVRSVGDELEQAMHGPHVELVTEQELRETRDIVRHALETVRLMNTGQLNKASRDRGVGMARMDTLNVNRALEPIFEHSVADSLAIVSRHERVLLALESGSLAWFARVLRDHYEAGDLSTEGRRKMPALMRGADGRHLALTRRQVNKIRAAAKYIAFRNGDSEK
jgi:hypothetical protein